MMSVPASTPLRDGLFLPLPVSHLPQVPQELPVPRVSSGRRTPWAWRPDHTVRAFQVQGVFADGTDSRTRKASESMWAH